jgi:RNA polymerase-binding transcription factor DksA
VFDSAEVPPDAALLDQVNADLGAVDEALRRLDDGTYGTCEVCGARLDPQRLEADPLLTLCPIHQG